MISKLFCFLNLSAKKSSEIAGFLVYLAVTVPCMDSGLRFVISDFIFP